MANLTQTEKLKYEKLFGMDSGYVLDFSNSSFQRFIFDTIHIDAYNDKFGIFGESKANRLRAIWQIESDYNVGLLLNEMLEYWKTKALLKGSSLNDGEKSIYDDCLNVNNRLLGLKKEKVENKEDFLKKDFGSVSLDRLRLDGAVLGVIEERIKEITTNLHSGASLSAIIMSGSVLEGILLGTASSNMRRFNESEISPKDKKTGKVLPFQDWTLSNLIDVAHNIGMLGLDVKKYSHSLRDFRNYIHPFQQMSSGFSPDKDTAEISWQVLKAAITDLSKQK